MAGTGGKHILFVEVSDVNALSRDEAEQLVNHLKEFADEIGAHMRFGPAESPFIKLYRTTHQ